MEKIIEIDIHDKYDLVDKYNEKNLSDELLQYIIKETKFINMHEPIKIIINKKCNIDIDSIKMIKDGLKREYNRTLDERHSNNMKQLFFLVLGTIVIFLASQLENNGMWKEILLIIGWVPIWKMIELELLADADARRERRIIKKLLSSEIIEK